MMKTIPISKYGDPITEPLTEEQGWEQSNQLDRQPPLSETEMMSLKTGIPDTVASLAWQSASSASMDVYDYMQQAFACYNNQLEL